MQMSETTNIMKKGDAQIEPSRQLRSIAPEVDILENEDEILLYVDLPGVSRENLTIQVDNGKMTLTGIRRLNVEGAATWEEFSDVEYQRVFSVPQSIDVNNVNAELRDGVLHLHLAKTPAAKPKKIEIKSA
jgi:HSP20 family molecular chaperone IbpA